MIAFPVRDVIPSRTAPVVTLVLIGTIAVAFAVELTLEAGGLHRVSILHRFAPAPFNPAFLVLSMFLHAGWVHLLANVLYLWLFGENVEDRMGHGRFLLLYIASGGAAAVGQAMTAPGSPLPIIGASGAISGVLAAYFVLFPRSRVLTFVWLVFYVDLVEVPALFFLGLWLILQLVSEAGSFGAHGWTITLWAHAAGLAAGAALALPLRRRDERW